MLCCSGTDGANAENHSTRDRMRKTTDDVGGRRRLTTDKTTWSDDQNYTSLLWYVRSSNNSTNLTAQKENAANACKDEQR